MTFDVSPSDVRKERAGSITRALNRAVPDDMEFADLLSLIAALSLCVDRCGPSETERLLRRGRRVRSAAQRQKLLKPFGNRCVYCRRLCTEKKRRAELDHLVPIATWGNDDDENLVLACSECNRLKGTATGGICPTCGWVCWEERSSRAPFTRFVHNRSGSRTEHAMPASYFANPDQIEFIRRYIARDGFPALNRVDEHGRAAGLLQTTATEIAQITNTKGSSPS